MTDDVTRSPRPGLDRRRALQAGIGAVGAAWIAPSVLASPAGAQTSTNCSCGGENLIVNPGGELYSGNPLVDNAASGFATPSSWVLTNNFRVVTYRDLGGPASVPTTSQFVGPPAPPSAATLGSVMFAGSFTNPPPGGPGLANSTAIQSIDISDCATRIDQSRMTYSLSAWLGGYDVQADRMVLQARFYGPGSPGTLLGSTTSLTVTNTDRGGTTGMRFRSATGTIPVGARRVEVQMTAIMAVAERYNAFADLLDLHLTCLP